ncbi:MAG: N-6 DNA methylase [Planctomycetes bacterium]|nr:N-6 DNA methylase [Planctomycetota bacterium]
MASVPKRVIQLVETFDRNIDAYKTQGYNETQVRREFIDPFFKALGWDIDNEQGNAPAYKDVIHEDAIKIGGFTKAPDYCFRIGGTRKFFLEAKKPSIDIKGDPSPAYQLRRYAWSAKLPLSILTDFEEFAVYDCLARPKELDKAVTNRIMYFTYKDYIKKWDEIASIFSKDAIFKGSFDKFAASAKGKRGTTTVDTEFLAEIEQWRSMLAKTIALKNRALNRDEINFAVQRIIDRILFLRICEDRGIEQYEQLLGLINGKDIYKRLCIAFERADEKYNSGLFYFRQEKGREDPDELTLDLNIDDMCLKWIIHSIYYPQSPYEFSVLPAEILGNVYEQFLGKVIQLKLHRRIKIEDKPEVKKAGGVYYTPSYIVDYIVENTVGKLCEDKTPKQISKLKILDPACGSGSFILGAYRKLLNYHRDWYVDNDPSKHKKQIFQGKGGQWFLTIAEKKRILLNNVFGVDIDFQAVEVTKLSLLLKVLEGETQETIGQTLKIFHERALPDLHNNIKCGNSLIGSDFYDDKNMDDFNEEQQQKINAFDWHSEFPDILSGKNPGFHAVIGNPPYIQLSMSDYYNKDISSYLTENFSSSMGRLNTFGLFIEKALKFLLRSCGFVSFIVPNTLLTQESYCKLRCQLLDYRLDSLTVFDFPVFEKAVVETVVFVLQKDSASNSNVNIIEYNNKSMNKKSHKVNQDIYLKTHNNSFLVRVDSSKLLLKSKIDTKGMILKKIVSINQAIALKQDRSKSLFKEIRGINYKPVLDGRNIQRYSLQWYGIYLAYDVKKIHSCKRTDIFETKEKIFFRRVGSGLVATYDNSQFYALNTLVVINLLEASSISIKYILSLLNSKLMNYYYVNYLKSTKKVFSEIQARQIGQLPIHIIDFNNPAEKTKHEKMVKLVDNMLDLNKKLAKAKIPAEKTRIQRQINTTDKKIDKLVYELYDLTEKEIKIVEESTK